MTYCPQCYRELPAPKKFTNPKGVGWEISCQNCSDKNCECSFRIITDSYDNLIQAGLAPRTPI
jgi:hypothetical protein